MMATLRSGHGIPCSFRATGNPGGPGHNWVRERYIDPAPLGYKIIEEQFKSPLDGTVITRERVFIPSLLSNNKYLGAEYVANLQMSGSPELVRAWLEGDWSIIAGAYFPEFSIAKHVIKPFPIPAHNTRLLGFDWGSASPFYACWLATLSDPTPIADGRLLPKGAAILYREWYGTSGKNKGIKMRNEEIGAGILARSVGETIQIKRADPSIFKEDGGPSIAQQMKVPFAPGDNTRVAGAAQVRSRLIGQDDRPMLYIFDTCPHIIRTLPALQHDPLKPEDLDTEGEDHPYDGMRYPLMARPYTRPAPVTKPIEGLNTMSINQLWEHEKRRKRA
jgi:hypothetical protein